MDGEVVLGISLGTRVMGMAVFYKGDLLEWKVKTFKHQWSMTKQKHILRTLERFSNAYSVSVIKMKKLDPLRSSKQLDDLLRTFITQSELVGIPVKLHSLSELDYDFMNKKQLSEKVSQRHPELMKKYLRARANRSEYYTKMFEAIALAEQASFVP